MAKKKQIAHIEPIDLGDRLRQARLRRDAQLAEVLESRPDLNYAQIQLEFRISMRVIRRVRKQFNLKARKRGPKT
jgi:hypothetical protein